MATLLNFLIDRERSRIIRLTCFDYDVIVIVCDYLDLSNFQNVRDTHDRVI